MIKINMGCGWRDFGKDWYHVDGGEYSHLDHKDIFKLPFKDKTVDLIYASHVIEYFDRVEIVNVLSEWCRVLKHGGVLRIAVPNFQELSRLYFEKKISLTIKVKPGLSNLKLTCDLPSIKNGDPREIVFGIGNYKVSDLVLIDIEK